MSTRSAAQGAQERGEVRKDGQRGKAIENSIPRTTDIGLTRKQVHEARQILEKVVKRPLQILRQDVTNTLSIFPLGAHGIEERLGSPSPPCMTGKEHCEGRR
jgi:hypothetical protein